MYIVQKHPTGQERLEIAVVVEGSHGTLSYGWHDNVNKIIILADQHVPNQRPYSKAMFELAMKEAQELCDQLNKENSKSDTLLKNMSVISGNRYATRKGEFSSILNTITSGGYDPEEMTGALYLCWYKEFEEMYKFPEQYRKVVATIHVDLTETIIEFRSDADNIKGLYISSIQAGYSDNLYPIEVMMMLEEKADHHCRILKNTSSRIIDFKTN